MAFNFIDTHAHLYDETFEQDLAEVVQSALDAQVVKCLLPNCDSTTYESMMQLTKDYPQFFHAMNGLHPCYVKENYEEELAFVEKKFEEGEYCAVGEIGLDFYWDKTFVKEQFIAFNQQIEWAKERKMPIVIHTRESIPEGIEVVRKQQDGNLHGVFHCFTGNLEEAKEIVELGFYIGIGGISTFKNDGLEEVIKEIPLSSILLETDAPYLAPTPYRGKRNESAYIPLIADQIAKFKSIDVEEVAKITTVNAQQLFKI